MDERAVLAVKKIIEEIAWERAKLLPEEKRERAFPKICDAICAELLGEN